MAGNLISATVWDQIEPLLPARQANAKGGRPAIGDREVLTGIIFVLKTGIPWEELPLELGCGCGMTCLRRLRSWQQTGVWQQIQAILEEGLRSSRRIDWGRVKNGGCDPGENCDPVENDEESFIESCSQVDGDGGVGEARSCSCQGQVRLPPVTSVKDTEHRMVASNERLGYSIREGMEYEKR